MPVPLSLFFLNHCNFVVSFEICKYEVANLGFLFQDCLAICYSLKFHMNVRVDFFHFCKVHVGGLIEIVLNLYLVVLLSSLDNTVLLIISYLLIHEYKIHLYLFMSSLISSSNVL